MRKTLLQVFMICGIILWLCNQALPDTASDLIEDHTSAGVPDVETDATSRFHGILGGGLLNFTKIVGDSDSRNLPLPLIVITYDDWLYWSFIGGGLWLLQSSDRLAKMGVGIKIHPGWKNDNDQILVGMADRKTSLDGYLNALLKTPVANITASLYQDIGNVSRGMSATIRFSHNFWVSPRFRLTPSAGAEWQSDKNVNYYYGVRPSEATIDRPAYEGTDTTNLGAGLGVNYRVGRNGSLLGNINATRLGSGITNSPIVNRDVSTFFFIGAGLNF